MSTQQQQTYHIPHALFNSVSMFNPYQYKPFSAVFEAKTTTDQQRFQWNGKNLLITDEVGVGKTFEAGIIMQEVLKNNSHASILIVCPVKLAQQWQRELWTHFFLGFTLFDGKNHLQTPGEALNQLSIVPYSSLDKIKESSFDLLVLDEAHYIRNQGASYGFIEKMVEQNPHAFKIFMTATPIFNSKHDYDRITGLLQSPTENQDGNHENFVTTTTLQGEANLYDYQMKIEHDQVSLAKTAEISIMTTVMEGGFGFLTGFLKRIAASSLYSLGMFLENREKKIAENKNDPKAMEKALKDSVDEEDYVDSMVEGQELVFSENEKALLQACQTWVADKYDSKFNHLTSLLERIQAPSDPQKGCTKGVVLFSCFISTGKYLKEKLSEYYNQTDQGVDVYQISGGMTKREVKNTIDKFSNQCKSAPHKLTILICSDAFKEGQNFQFCQHLIHYDFPYTPAAMGQRNGRIYRTGQAGAPKSYYITVENSYDYRLFGEIIVSKAAIVGDFAKEGKISILHVLPEKSEEFLKQSLLAYFQGQVEKEISKTKTETLTEEQGKERVFKHLFKNLTRKEMTDFSETLVQVMGQVHEKNYESAFVALFLSIQEDQSLLTTYQEKYKEQLQAIQTLFFGESEACEGDLDALKTAFVQHCAHYLEEKNIGAQQFCHHLYGGKVMPFQQYTTQFKALCILEREVNDR